MKGKLFVVLFLTMFPISGIWSQWLPVRSHTLAINYTDGDSLDGKFAELPYRAFYHKGLKTRYAIIINYEALDTIYPWDSYTMYIHASIPPVADFKLAMRTDSTIWSIIYDWKPVREDNTYKPERIDTVLTIDVPAFSVFHYGQPFTQFSIIYNRYNWPDTVFSVYSARVDGLYLEKHPPKDTVTRDTVQDTVITKDTTTANVYDLFPKPVSVWDFYNILGQRVTDTANCRPCIAIDQFGRKRLIR